MLYLFIIQHSRPLQPNNNNSNNNTDKEWPQQVPMMNVGGHIQTAAI